MGEKGRVSDRKNGLRNRRGRNKEWIDRGWDCIGGGQIDKVDK